MKITKLFVIAGSLMITTLAIASPLSTFPLDGVTVNHHSRGLISLRTVERGRWNVDCQYKVMGANPNPGNPLAVSIQGSYLESSNEVTVSGSGYTPNGLTSPSGNLKINNVWRGMAGSVSFDNYDSTGDLIIFNCSAWRF